MTSYSSRFSPVGIVDYPNSNGLYPATWLPLPDYKDGALGGYAQSCWMLCRVDQRGANRFAFRASGSYTLDVLTAVDGVLIYTVNAASNVQSNFKVNYNSCSVTSTQPDGARLCIVRITPQMGQNLTTLALSGLLHPEETTVSSSSKIIWSRICGQWLNVLALNASHMTEYFELYGPNVIASGSSLLAANFSLKSIDLLLPMATSLLSCCAGAYTAKTAKIYAPMATNLTTLFSGCYCLTSAIVYCPLALTMTNFLGAGTSSSSCYNLQSLELQDCTVGFVMNYTAMGATEANALVASLGNAKDTSQVLDFRNNPFSADPAFDIAAATAKGYTVLLT